MGCDNLYDKVDMSDFYAEQDAKRRRAYEWQARPHFFERVEVYDTAYRALCAERDREPSAWREGNDAELFEQAMAESDAIIEAAERPGCCSSPAGHTVSRWSVS